VGHAVDVPEPLAEVMARSHPVPEVDPTLSAVADVVFEDRRPDATERA
jgi:threonine synthase